MGDLYYGGNAGGRSETFGTVTNGRGGGVGLAMIRREL